jgi:hypothetical protein
VRTPPPDKENVMPSSNFKQAAPVKKVALDSRSEKSNDFDVSTSQMRQFADLASEGSNHKVMLDLAKEIADQPAKPRGYSPLVSENDLKLRASATPYVPKSEDRLTGAGLGFDPMALMTKAQGDVQANQGGKGFITDAGMSLVQDADQFLPLMKTLLHRCTADNQKHLLRYLLSIQQAPVDSGPSGDPIDLRIQFERDQEELREVKSLMD